MVPTQEEIEAVVECARYGDEGDLEDIQRFVEAYGNESLSSAKDERGNTCLHMACANGHADIVAYVLDHVNEECRELKNEADSTALHWAAVNFHLDVLKLLCPRLSKRAFEVRNAHGKTAYDEARERCEAFLVGADDQEGHSERAKERIRREVVVGYLQGFTEPIKDDTGDKTETEETPDVSELDLNQP